MFERYTKDARHVVLTAVTTAADTGAAKVAPEHLLLTLAAAGEGVGARVLGSYGVTAAGLQGGGTGAQGQAGFTDEEISALRSVGIDAEEVFRRIEEAFGPGALDEPATPAPSRRRGLVGGPLDREAKKVIELSLREAIALHHRYIGTEHMLLALLRQGVAAPMSTVLTEHGVTYQDAKQRVLTELHKAA
jgi:ATP-dependent Clp protease ATP-binding subunit ClpA